MHAGEKIMLLRLLHGLPKIMTTLTHTPKGGNLAASALVWPCTACFAPHYVSILVASAKLSRPTRRIAGNEANNRVINTPNAVRT